MRHTPSVDRNAPSQVAAVAAVCIWPPGTPADPVETQVWTTLEPGRGPKLPTGARPIPLLVPRRPIRDHLAFDRAVCKAGLKEFIRQNTPSDQLVARTTVSPALEVRAQHTDPNPFVLVVEHEPGFRSRSTTGGWKP